MTPEQRAALKMLRRLERVAAARGCWKMDSMLGIVLVSAAAAAPLGAVHWLGGVVEFATCFAGLQWATRS